MKSVLDVQVSAYKNYYSKDPKTVNLLKWLNSDKYADKVLEVRKETDKSKRDSLKSQLPVITVSGLFDGRGSDKLIKHSGLIAIDIDYDHNRDIINFGDLKKEISKLDEIAYCGLSVSGNGYFCIIKIADPDDHISHFNAIYEDFKEWINIDQSCSDVSRLRGYSYDPEAYFNHDAETYSKKLESEKILLPESKLNQDLAYELSKVESLIKQIEQKGVCILAPQSDGKGGYINYFENVMVSLFNTFGEKTAYNLFLRLCKVCLDTEFNDQKRYHRYSPESARKILDRLVQSDKNYKPSPFGKKTIASFYRLCKDLNISYKIDWKPYNDTIEFILDGREDYATYMLEENDLKVEYLVRAINEYIPKLSSDQKGKLISYKQKLTN